MSIVLSKMFSAHVILGSATPSLESYYNAKTVRCGYVQLTTRYTDEKMPKIELVDLRQELKNKEISGDITITLNEAIQKTIKEGKQVLIYQNRGGFAPILEWLSCGHSPFCPIFDVPLTYHKFTNLLKCHYCGHSQSKPSKCYSCQSLELTTKGIGTQQIEQLLEELFPKLKVARMDVDAMRRKNAYEKTIDRKSTSELQILIGKIG